MKIEKLFAAIEALSDVSAYEMAVEFATQTCNGTGHYISIQLEPSTGEWHIGRDASWSCTADEYFFESGVLSRMTVHSGNDNFSPGPNDGFEWDENEDGEFWAVDGNWCNDDALESYLEKNYEVEYEEGTDLESIAKSLGFYRFSVSTTPCDPDYSDLEEIIQEVIDKRIKLIEEEIESESL